MSTDFMPTYDEEVALIEDGFTAIAGVDEAGRGSLAGPVVAAAAILPVHPSGEWLLGVRDSKRLTPRQRELSLKPDAGRVCPECDWNG